MNAGRSDFSVCSSETCLIGALDSGHNRGGDVVDAGTIEAGPASPRRTVGKLPVFRPDFLALITEGYLR